MSNRRVLVLATIMLALGTAGARLLLRSGEPERSGVVRISAPVETATPTMSPSPAMALPSPRPAPTTEPGIDPPAPPQENGSPDYAKLGVQPTI